MPASSEKIEQLKNLIRERSLITRDQQKSIAPTGKEHAWIFDLRRVLLSSDALPLVADIFWDIYGDLYPFQVCGQETAAIPLIAAIIMRGSDIGKPVNGFYIRKSRKNTGLQSIFEGRVDKKKIILIDDLVNSGETIEHQLVVLKEMGLEPTDIFTLIQFRSPEDYSWTKEKKMAHQSLYTLKDFNVAMSQPSPTVPNPYKVLWRFQSSNPSHFHVVPKSAPAIFGDKIFFGSDSQTFWALRKSDGSVAWQFKVGRGENGKSIFSSPAIFDGCVYFGSYDGNVYALNSETGNVIWVHHEADWVGSSPALAPDLGLLFIGLEYELPGRRGSLAALDLKTGKKIWEYFVSDYVHCSPAYSASRQLVAIGANDANVYLLDAKSGRLMWSYKTGGAVKASLIFCEEENTLAFGSFDGYLYMLDLASGLPRHIFKTEGLIYATPVQYEKNIIFPSTDKRIYSVNLESGIQNWSLDVKSKVFASPLLHGESVFIGANDGKLRELDPKTGRAKSAFQVTEQIVNKIAFDAESGHIYLPTSANEIYCLQKQNS